MPPPNPVAYFAKVTREAAQTLDPFLNPDVSQKKMDIGCVRHVQVSRYLAWLRFPMDELTLLVRTPRIRARATTAPPGFHFFGPE